MIGRGLWELRRRRVLRSLGLYIFVSWIVLSVFRGPAAGWGAGPASVTLAAWMLAALFLPTLVFSWVFRWTHEGVAFEHAHAGRPPRTWFGRTLDVLAIVGGIIGAVGLVLMLRAGVVPEAPPPAEAQGLFARP